MKPVRHGLALALGAALCACSASEDKSKLVGSYTLVVPAGQNARKDFAGSTLRLTRDGMFTQQCRYKTGKTDSAIGTWTYSNRRAKFSVFKDCAGVLPSAARKEATNAGYLVEFESPTRIVVSPGADARYERHGVP